MTQFNVDMEVFDTLETLPSDCEGLFAAGAERNFHLSRAWFRTLLAAAMAPGKHPLFLLFRVRGRAVMLLPLQHDGTQLEGLSSVYTCLYQPLASPDVTAAELQAVGHALGRFCRSWAALRLDALDHDWLGLPPLLRGVRKAGLVALTYNHFGNWYEPVSDRSWDDYVAARPGALRQTIRRRLRSAERDPSIAVDVIEGLAGLEPGIAAYDEVYSRSWKEPEPFPAFNAALLRAASAEHVLRLGVLSKHGRPVAAQYWIVTSGVASVLKLAHDEEAKGISPGTVLTAMMVRRLLEKEQLTELDFGRGDDPYKALWVSQHRQRIGVVIASPWRPTGITLIARHLMGRTRNLLSASVNVPYRLTPYRCDLPVDMQYHFNLGRAQCRVL